MCIIRWRGLEFFLEGMSVSIWVCISYNTMETPHSLETLRAPCSFMNRRRDAPYSLPSGYFIYGTVSERYSTCLLVDILFKLG